MKNKLTKKWVSLAILMLLLTACITSSCAERVVYKVPQMGEAAVLDLPLPDPPILNLTDEETRAIYKACPSGMVKILDNQAEWFGVYDIATGMKETYINYLRDVFGRDKVKGK